MAERHFFEILKEEVPSLNQAFFDMVGTIQKDAGLDEKTFQLVYIAIKASVGEAGAAAAHAGMAKKVGATRDEVRGAVLITMMTHGVTGIASCLGAVLDAYDKA